MVFEEDSFMPYALQGIIESVTTGVNLRRISVRGYEFGFDIRRDPNSRLVEY